MREKIVTRYCTRGYDKENFEEQTKSIQNWEIENAVSWMIKHTDNSTIEMSKIVRK